MKNFLLITTVALLLISTFSTAVAQPAFQNEIQAFKKQDNVSPPPANAILFVGSSSFRKWTDVQAYFPGYTIINRGFGGSVLPDVVRYANDIIIPYRPKQVLIYCGDNDLASSDSITPQMVAGRFSQLFTVIRNALPKSKVSFVSIKPSPSRERLMPKMKQANSLIKSFLAKQKNTSYINVFNPMLLPNGKPKPDLFLEDKLHMNEKGYAIWQKAIQPYLIK
jgi:lysophospholipase L1-like esterase